MPIALWVLGSLLLAYLGKNSKFGFWGMFFCSMLLTPVIGLLVLLASNDKYYEHKPVD
jgi:hypothetical protein